MTPETVLIIFACIVGLGLLAYGAGIYNNLVQVRNNVGKAWENIDVILMQRYHELPKLIDTCRGYMAHEADLLERLTEMRTGYESAKGMTEKTQIENKLQASMSQLHHVWEAYPALRATENFQQIQRRVSVLESTIADRRELFNDSINIYNIQVESFPDLLVAKLFDYQRLAFLDVPEHKREDVDMDFGQKTAQKPVQSNA